MENVVKTDKYFQEILYHILYEDKLHFRSLSQNHYLNSSFEYFKNIICEYFIGRNISPEDAAHDYLLMIYEMRSESKYFLEHLEYSCKSESDAESRVYSNPFKMQSYMNALLLSQILWEHHFRMLKFFEFMVKMSFQPSSPARILDIGAGHALYSVIATDNIPGYKSLDIVDLSSASLNMASTILKGVDFSAHKKNIHDFQPLRNYDLIIMGEVLEHVEQPLNLLKAVKNLLAPEGIAFISVPTNAPAIDHIFLFRRSEEIESLIREAKFEIVESINIPAHNSITTIVGVYCR